MASTDTLSYRPASEPRGVSTPTRNVSLASAGNPRTPLFSRRSTSYQYDSPGRAYQTDDHTVVFAIEPRQLELGLAGDADPRGLVRFSPQLSARLDGSIRHAASTPSDSLANWELYALDTRDLDLGLVYDKLERCLRKLFTEQLMLDVKGHKAVIAVPAQLSDPVLHVILRALFESVQQPPSITLLTDTVACLVAAGLRSALVVDIGWHETTVSAVYEYRIVLRRSSTRAMKLLNDQVSLALTAASRTVSPLPFSAVEQVIQRLAYCPLSSDIPSSQTEPITIPITATLSTTLSRDTIPQTVTETFLNKAPDDHSDDGTYPLPDLLWRILSSLSHDVRGTLLPRIIITGSGSKIPGLSTRLRSDLAAQIATHGFSTTHYKPNTRSAQTAKRKVASSIQQREWLRNDQSAPVHDDDIHAQIMHDRIRRVEAERRAVSCPRPNVEPAVRGVETLGSFAGASMAAHLRLRGCVEIKRDEFARWGLGGKSLAL